MKQNELQTVSNRSDKYADIDEINDLLTFFRRFPGHVISGSTPDEPAMIIAGQITCPQGIQTLFDFFCTQS